MRTLLKRVVDEALRATDTIDDLVAEVALGFAAAAPVIAVPGCETPDNGPCDSGRASLTHAEG